jgi:ribosome-associated translation inhibitor RaiA
MHVLSGGGKVDPEVTKQAAKNAADPMVLKEQGFSHDEATRISELPEDQRIKAITDGWNKRTQEDIEAGKQLQKDNYQQVLDIINSPNAPKLVNNYDGTFHVITMTPEGESHTATFTDKDAAETAYTDAMKDHLQSEYDRTMKEGNDWTTATADDAKTVLDEGRKPSPAITIQVPDIVITSGDHPSEEIKLSATAEGDESTKAIDLLNTNLQAETEREKAKGNDVSDTTVSAATPEQLQKAKNDPAYKLADRIAKIFGKKVVLYNTDKGNAGNGFINTSDALKDYIFLKADGARPHMFTLGHVDVVCESG